MITWSITVQRLSAIYIFQKGRLLQDITLQRLPLHSNTWSKHSNITFTCNYIMHIDIVKTMYPAVLILSLTITLPHYGPVKKAEACGAGSCYFTIFSANQMTWMQKKSQPRGVLNLKQNAVIIIINDPCLMVEHIKSIKHSCNSTAED